MKLILLFTLVSSICGATAQLRAQISLRQRERSILGKALRDFRMRERICEYAGQTVCRWSARNESLADRLHLRKGLIVIGFLGGSRRMATPATPKCGLVII